MQDTAAQIFADQSVSRIEPAIAPMAEVFRLQRVDELESAEQRYLSNPPRVRAAVNQ